MTARGQRKVKALAVLLLASAVALATAEIAWRCFGPAAQVYHPWEVRVTWEGMPHRLDQRDHDVLMEHDLPGELADLRGRFRPGIEFQLCYDLAGEKPRGSMDEQGCVRVVINGQGFRGSFPEVQRSAATGPSPGGHGAASGRLLVLGDSVTFGHGVGEGLAWPFQLSSFMGRELEVINLAASGYDVKDCAILLDAIGLEYRPDLVLYAFYQNDLFVGGGLDAQAGALAEAALIDPFAEARGLGRWSKLADAWQRHRQRSRLQGQIHSAYEGAVAPDSADMIAWRAELVHMAGACRSLDIPFVMVLFPELSCLEGRASDLPLAHVYQRVQEVCRAEGVAVIDVFPAWQGQRARELWVHATDHHPGPRAQALAAELIGERIVSLLP